MVRPEGTNATDTLGQVSLYRPPTYDGAPPVDVGETVDRLRERVDADVTVRERFLDAHRADDLFEAFAGARVLDPHDRDAPPREVLENQVEGEFLVENDPRTTAALEGYVLRAVHLAATGEGFRDDERCRPSNPHRHEGVVEARL